MKKIVMQTLGAAMLAASASGAAMAEELFTGDRRLACEAVLCLSSSQRPGECSPSLDRYFGINHKKLSDTLDARRSFLNMCPSSHDVSSNMPQFVEDIVNGAGRCDAEYLNRTQRVQLQRKVCTGWGGGDAGESCHTETYTAVKNSLPNYCVAYWGNNYTDLDIAKYIGTVEQEGKWVSNKDYVTEQARWEQAHPPKAEEYSWLKR